MFKSESAALAWIKSRVVKGTVLNADEAAAWNPLHERFEVKRINHQEAYSLNGACTNWAESYFARLRRGEAGHHHHIAGPYLLRFAQEASWREDNRRVSNGDQVHRVAGLAMGWQAVSRFQRLLAAPYQDRVSARLGQEGVATKEVGRQSISAPICIGIRRSGCKRGNQDATFQALNVIWARVYKALARFNPAKRFGRLQD